MEKIPKEINEEISNKIKSLITIPEGSNVGVFLTPMKKEKVEDFVMVFQRITEMASKSLRPSSCKVLLYFISKCVYGNSVGIDILTMMDDLKLCKTTTINAINELKDANVVLLAKDTNDHRRNVYYINPHQAWKGKARTRSKYVKKLTEAHGTLDLFENAKEE